MLVWPLEVMREIRSSASRLSPTVISGTTSCGCASNATTASRCSAVEQIERGERGGLRHLDLLAAHARRAVDEQDQVQVLVLALGLERDRQQLLDLALGEAFLAVGVLPRREDQAAATVANERPQALHGIRPQAVRAHVAEDDDVLAVEQPRHRPTGSARWRPTRECPAR